MPLSGLASFRSGLWTGKKGPFTTAKVIRNTNIRKYGRLSFDDIAEIEVEMKQLETRRLQHGDIILERSGGGPKQAVGRAVCFELEERDFSFSNFMSVIRIQDRDRLAYRFLHLVLNWWYEAGVTEGIQSNSTGIRNLDFNAYKELGVPLPPLGEQQRIVAILDEAFDGLARARANAEANLKNAWELFETVREVVLDPEKTRGMSFIKLERLIDIKHGFAFKSEFFAKEGSHVVLTPGNFFETGGYKDRGAKQKYYSGEVPRDYVLSEGDLLMAMTEQAPGLLGSCIIVPESDRFLHNQRLGLISPKGDVAWDAEFLFHVFNLKVFRQALSDSCTGATVRHTSPSRIKAVHIPYVDDVQIQRRIAEHLSNMADHIRQLKSEYRNRISDFDNLRQSLLQKAFAGELT
jgi:type I restriction enzyme, S subunit